MTEREEHIECLREGCRWARVGVFVMSGAGFGFLIDGDYGFIAYLCGLLALAFWLELRWNLYELGTLNERD